jgi:hypothetical protein
VEVEGSNPSAPTIPQQLAGTTLSAGSNSGPFWVRGELTMSVAPPRT